MLPTYILLGLPRCVDGPQPHVQFSELGPALKTGGIFIMQINMNIYVIALAGGSSGLLDLLRPSRPSGVQAIKLIYAQRYGVWVMR